MDRKHVVVFVGVLALAAASGTVVLSGALSDTADDRQFEEVGRSIGFGHFPIQEPENPPGSGRQGVYVADHDNDHWDDLLVVGGRDSPVLYENTGGAFNRSGALPDDPIMETSFKGALFLDYDNDGWEDLLLLAPHPDSSVFLENRNGSYHVDQTGFFFQMPNGATTLDYNEDGCLDVFVYQNGHWGETNPKAYRNPTDTVTEDNGNPNYLLEGDCSSFEFVNGTEAGISGNHWSLTASAVDFDGDGHTDIHVANDFYNDTLYYNNGDGTFDRVELGATTNRNGMASEVGDVNGDGLPDLFVTNIRVPALEGCLPMSGDSGGDCSDVGRYIQRYVGDRNEGNNLLINQGNRTFVDRSEEYGVSLGGWGWAASLSDFDNDGDLDLFHTSESLPFDDRDVVSRPKYFERVGPESFRSRNVTRMGFDKHNGRGLATLDYDRDGDLDFVIAEHPRSTVFDIQFYENKGSGDGNWLGVRVTKSDDGPALGGRVEIDTGNETVVRWVNPRTDFFSQESRLIHVGLGDRETVEEVRVIWPDGTTETLSDVAANQKLVVSPGNVTRLDGTESDDGGGLLPFTLPSAGGIP
jgi:hypothetical protein